MKVEQIYMPNCILAEGCVWNRNNKMLYFTDIEGKQIYELLVESGIGTVMQTNQSVGCLVPHKDGGIVIAETNHLIHWNNHKRYPLLSQSFPSYLRYNDGKCDSYGNLWVGTMAKSQAHPLAKGGGSLYCLGKGQVKAEYPGYTIPNGLVWADRQTFYHIDTALQRVEVYEVQEEGVLQDRKTVIWIPEEEGNPDGMCMDTNGNLWIAMWGGGRVNGYDPRSGKKIEEILVPDSRVTCCCFGGVQGKQLFVTTARDESGIGGQVYCADMDVCGVEEYMYGG